MEENVLEELLDVMMGNVDTSICVTKWWNVDGEKKKKNLKNKITK